MAAGMVSVKLEDMLETLRFLVLPTSARNALMLSRYGEAAPWLNDHVFYALEDNGWITYTPTTQEEIAKNGPGEMVGSDGEGGLAIVSITDKGREALAQADADVISKRN